MDKPLFVLDRQTSLLSENVFIYRYMRWSPNTLYVVFTNLGVKFCINSSMGSTEKTRYSSNIMTLPLSLDSDSMCRLSSTLNAIYPDRIEETGVSEDAMLSVFDVKDESGMISGYVFPFSVGISRMRVFSDFVYEFERGGVFRQDPLYEMTFKILHSHHLFNAIVNKLEYCNARKRFETYLKNNAISNNMSLDDLSRKEYEIELSSFADSERRWVEMIVNPQSEMVFHEAKWFKNEAVGELNDVYLNSLTLESGRFLDGKQGRGRYIAEVIRGTMRMAVRWYMSKYRLDGVLKIRLGESAVYTIWGMSLSLVILTILSILYVFVYENIQTCFVWRTVFMILAIAVAMLGILSYMIPSIRARGRSKLCRADIIPNIIMPRLFASIAAGWMTVGLSDLVAEGVRHDYHDYATISIFVIPAILLPFIWLSVRNVHPYASLKAQCNITFIVFCISAIYSILMGAFLLQIYSGKPYFFGCDVEGTAPKTLLVFALISMFVGIFINMLFNGKSISSVEN